MIVDFGKNKGKSPELLVLKNPGWIKWTISNQTPAGPMISVQEYAKMLIAIFDEKPIFEPCYENNCKNVATRCSVVSGDVYHLHWWCDECDPSQMGVSPEDIQMLRSYHDAIGYVDVYCDRRETDLEELIRSMAEARGLPKLVDESQAQNFFK